MVRKCIPTVEGKSGLDGGPISVDIDNDFVYYYQTIVLILLLRVLVKGTKELKIKYDGASDAGLIGYSDSDWGENRDDRHSTSGHVFLMANGAISWASQ